ncbi:MAG: PH domain-containing protein [Erysipelotrichaceae bacterium]|nr:PH domain-containing protein [Erysipelotrichaceae bacterium]
MAQTRKFKFFGETKIPYFINRLLFPNERIAVALKAFRDVAVITDKRFLIINQQYLSGKSVEYVTFLYKNIINYSISTPGILVDFDVDVVANFINGDVVHMEFSKGNNIEQYIFLIYDLISAALDNHPFHAGVFNPNLSIQENNEQFFE